MGAYHILGAGELQKFSDISDEHRMKVFLIIFMVTILLKGSNSTEDADKAGNGV